MFASKLTILLMLYRSNFFVYILCAFYLLVDRLLEFQEVNSDTIVLGLFFDSISIVEFFIKLSKYPIVPCISTIIITRFLKVIQLIPLNLLFSRKTSGL